MHPMLAESIGGMLIAAGLLFGGLAASILALFALRPAARGDQPATLKLIAPAVIMALANVVLWGSACAKILSTGDFVQLLFGLLETTVWVGAPLATSLLALIVLRRRRKKGI